VSLSVSVFVLVSVPASTTHYTPSLNCVCVQHFK